MRPLRCFALLCLVALSACRTTRKKIEPPPGPTEFEEGLDAEAEEAGFASEAVSFARGWHVGGESVEGRELRYWSSGGEGEAVLLIATIHGDEHAGTPLCERLVGELEQRPSWAAQRRVIVVPVANPDGYAAEERENAHGIDLNRNFPSGNFAASEEHGAAPLSEPESRFLHELVLAFDPVRVMSIHQPVNLIDWDGPGEELARALAEAVDMRARRLGSRPGSFGSWVGLDLETPILTVELPGGAQRLASEDLWARYGALMRGMVRG